LLLLREMRRTWKTAKDVEDQSEGRCVDHGPARAGVGRRSGAHPSPLIDLRAPVAGTIVEQNVAGFEGVKELGQYAESFYNR